MFKPLNKFTGYMRQVKKWWSTEYHNSQMCENNKREAFANFFCCCCCCCCCLKQYYKIWPEMKNFTFSFFYHKIMKWHWLSPYSKASAYLYWLLCTKLKYSTCKYSFSYTILQYKLYQDPCKGNCRLCHNYNSYSFHIHTILSILNVLSIYVNTRKFVG